MNSKFKIGLFVAEVAAVATLRAVFLLKQQRQILPRGSKVGRVGGRPVFSKSAIVGSFKRRKEAPPQPRSIKVGSMEIPLADPDLPGYDSGLAE